MTVIFWETMFICRIFAPLSEDLFYINTRNRPGALGRAVVGYLGKALTNLPFKVTAGHFNRDPVVISKGIRGLEKRIGEDEAVAATITMLSESLTKNRNPILI